MARKRQEASVEVSNIKEFISKALYFANSFDHTTYYNNNNLPYLYDAFPHMLMIGCRKALHTTNPFKGIKEAHKKDTDWYTGYFGYDLKNIVENLSSNNINRQRFPEYYFFIPEHILFFQGSRVTINSYDNPWEVFEKINSLTINRKDKGSLKNKNVEWQSAMSVAEYLEKVASIQKHILNGDIYEMNFCLEFYAQGINIDPLDLYLKLNDRSPMPFSIYGKFNDQYLLCASPERFIKKKGKKLISQPIKGTARRGKTKDDDERIKNDLRHDEKEQAENLMIVDLVRNDLARSSNPGSVKVEELFGIYSFRQVHQMISTVTSEIKDSLHFSDAIKNAFPMGSMTGAPKVKVMELIEHYENSKRGVYSGAAGFITPDGDFDFNVVIRSLFYDDKSKTLSFQVGSAITFDSIAEKEYEECLLKARAMMEVVKEGVL